MPRAAWVDSAGYCQRVETVSDLAFAPGAIDGGPAMVGWHWDGSQWTPPAAKRKVPAEVTLRQAKRALADAGLLSAVDAAIASLPEPQRTAATIDWQDSNAVQRDNATFVALATALGLSSEQIDSFMLAAEAHK